MTSAAVSMRSAGVPSGASGTRPSMTTGNEILLDGCIIGAGSLVGAGALVTPGTHIPPGSLVIGSPARVKRPVDAKEREAIHYGAHHYVELTRRYLAGEDESSLG